LPESLKKEKNSSKNKPNLPESLKKNLVQPVLKFPDCLKKENQQIN